MRASSYTTRQRETLLRYLMGLDGEHVTIEQLTEHFAKDAAPVGRTTIYRYLAKLEQEGLVRRFKVDGLSSACYQFIREPASCGDHFHLKCEQCGTLVHLECDSLAQIQQHVLAEHSFRINPLKTVFYGLCEGCQ
ncbi:MAG: transcriptional repressor [Coriobacteriales bacterium]|jgi:Fur family ferric uptake transcriptional regulator|nr:transcriptional repressor [Coriobacteriales bacterium]